MQSAGPTCTQSLRWQSSHGVVAALNLSVGWHSVQERDSCAAPSLIVPGWVIAFVGFQALVVWQFAHAENVASWGPVWHAPQAVLPFPMFCAYR